MSERFNPKKALQFVLTGAVAMYSIGGIFESPRVGRTLKALNPPGPSCDEIVPGTKPYGVITLFGIDEKGFSPGENKINLLQAAAKAYVANSSNKVLIIGNIPGYKETSMIKELKGYVSTLSGGQTNIDRESIDFINHSFSFGQGMENLTDYMKSNNLTNALGIASWVYVDRLRLLQENNGIDMVLTPSECNSISPSFKVDQDVSDTLLGEELLIIETFLDPTQKLTGPFKSAIQSLKPEYGEK